MSVLPQAAMHNHPDTESPLPITPIVPLLRGGRYYELAIEIGDLEVRTANSEVDARVLGL